VKGFPGPVVLLPVPPTPSADALRFAAQVAVRYSDAPPGHVAEVAYTDGDTNETLQTAACRDEDIQTRMI